jgi:hypothetical protein
MFVKKATVEYHASARLDDTLDVGLRCARVGTSSSLFQAGIFSGERLLVSGELVYVFADPVTQTSRPVPPALRAMFEAHEAGEDMAEVQTGDWNALGRDAGRLRTAVFPRAMRWSTTGWAWRWPPGGCCRNRRAWGASGAWRWSAPCAVASGGARCWTR